MDETDRRILAALVANGRATLQEVSDEVGLRRPSVHARVKRLEEEGVIRGYHASLDPEQVDGGLVAFVFLHVVHGDGRDCMAACGTVAERLRQNPAVLEFHTLAGDDDAVAKVRAKDVRHLERIVLKEISQIPEIRRVRTMIVMSTQFERPIGHAPVSAPRRPRSA